MIYRGLLTEDKGYSTFERQFSRGENGHAYLFECKDKILYRHLFSCCASVAIGEKDNAEIYDKILRQVVPDVYFFPAEGREKMTVADVSQIVAESSTLPAYAEKKVFCIDASNSAREEWQNKLLKILEEPPKSVIFLLACPNADELLLTVKSRCQVVSVGNFTEKQIADFLNKNGIFSAKAKECAILSQGSVGKAKYIADNPIYLGCIDDMCDMLLNMSSTKKMAEFVPVVGKYRSSFGDMLEILENIFGDVIRIQTKCDYVLNLSKKDAIIKISQLYTADAAWRCITAIEYAKAQLDKYVGFFTVMDGLLLKFLEVKYRCRL